MAQTQPASPLELVYDQRPFCSDCSPCCPAIFRDPSTGEFELSDPQDPSRGKYRFRNLDELKTLFERAPQALAAL